MPCGMNPSEENYPSSPPRIPAAHHGSLLATAIAQNIQRRLDRVWWSGTAPQLPELAKRSALDLRSCDCNMGSIYARIPHTIAVALGSSLIAQGHH